MLSKILFLFCFFTEFSRKVSPPSVIESVSKHNNRKVGECVGESTSFRLHHTHGGPQGDPDRREEKSRAPFLFVFLFVLFSDRERERMGEEEESRLLKEEKVKDCFDMADRKR